MSLTPDTLIAWLDAPSRTLAPGASLLLFEMSKDTDRIADSFLGPTATRKVHGSLVYRLYVASSPDVKNECYRDLDGEVLAACHVFATVGAARRWLNKRTRVH